MPQGDRKKRKRQHIQSRSQVITQFISRVVKMNQVWVATERRTLDPKPPHQLSLKLKFCLAVQSILILAAQRWNSRGGLFLLVAGASLH